MRLRIHRRPTSDAPKWRCFFRALCRVACIAMGFLSLGLSAPAASQTPGVKACQGGDVGACCTLARAGDLRGSRSPPEVGGAPHPSSPPADALVLTLRMEKNRLVSARLGDRLVSGATIRVPPRGVLWLQAEPLAATASLLLPAGLPGLQWS